MNVLFLQDYREIQLGILRTRVNQAVINASADVYLEIAQNVSDMYNKSLMVADSRCLLKVIQLMWLCLNNYLKQLICFQLEVF